MTKVLIIGYVWPEPNSSAAGSRMMQLIHFFLEQDYHVTFASPATESSHRYAFETLGVTKQNIEVNNTSFDTFILQLQPDIVLFDRFLMEEQFAWRVEKHCPDAMRIIETVDLHCLREARHIAIKQKRDMTNHDLFSEIAQREIASILRSDLSLMISSIEIELLTDQFKVDASLLLHLPFMLESLNDSDINALPRYENRQHFISIGNYRHAPNWDAVLYLKQILWPMIQERLPDAEMHIYGAYPPPKANQLHKPADSFHILGWAESAEDVMKNARVCLAPIRFGAGLKGKLLDAMHYGTPSVTTKVGAEGMYNHLEWNGVIASNDKSFVSAAVSLYNNEKKWESAQQNGFSLLNTL